MAEHPPGRLELILGPMFSGKSTELQRRVRVHQVARRSCLVVKHAADDRYGASAESIVTHAQATAPAGAAVRSLADLGERWRNFDCVAVDEGQFFPDLQASVAEWCAAGRVVVVAGLDGDFRREPFGQMVSLVPLAESVTKLSAVCMRCFRAEAAFTKRLTAEPEQELVGGTEAYAAMCRACYDRPTTT